MHIKSHTSAIKFGKSAHSSVVLISILVNFVSVSKLCIKESKEKNCKCGRVSVYNLSVGVLSSSEAHFHICIRQLKSRWNQRRLCILNKYHTSRGVKEH